MELRGKTVLVTRRAEQADELRAELERHGARAVVIPMIRIVEPEQWRAFDDTARNAASFDAVIFTSTNAVEAFFRRLMELKADVSVWHAKRVYAVGEKTRGLLERYGFDVALVPESYSAEGLAAVVLKADVKGLKFLLPQGNLGRDVLPAALERSGARVCVVQVYRNVPPEDSVLTEVKQRVQGREFDVVTFASPSAVQNFARAVAPETLIETDTRVAVIGPTTAHEARRLGFAVDIEAQVATAQGLVEALKLYSDRTS
ncbi:MAG TPA: uroporphyrinogen-III synthase [Bacteroidota bacterium]|nr:uroporphyrinogen-III synthase [Bacteroidota bacterium]